MHIHKKDAHTDKKRICKQYSKIYKPNMHKYAISKYALCLYIHYMFEYAEVQLSTTALVCKNAVPNMKKNMKYSICKKYASSIYAIYSNVKICKK